MVTTVVAADVDVAPMITIFASVPATNVVATVAVDACDVVVAAASVVVVAGDGNGDGTDVVAAIATATATP